MRKLAIRARETGFAAIAGAIWNARLPAGIRVALARAILARSPGTGRLSRQFRLLMLAIARQGARALVETPEDVARLLREAERHGARAFLIAGDSHSALYVHRSRRQQEWLFPLHYLATAASARGLDRSESSLRHGEAIQHLLANLSQTRLRIPVMFVFGQVDVEFVYMFKRLATDPPAAADAIPIEDFGAETIVSYITFARRMKNETGAEIHLATIFPPALSDAAWRQGYLNANIALDHAGMPDAMVQERLARTEIATLPVRTAQHGHFNERLTAAAKIAGLPTLDAASQLPKQDGVVSTSLLGAAAGSDHHLDAEALWPYVVQALWQTLPAQA